MIDLTPEEVRLIEEHRRKHPPTPSWKPRAAANYSTDEKCDAFDRLHAMALEHFDQAKNGMAHDDDVHYIFEAVMELLDKDVWIAYNQFLEQGMRDNAHRLPQVLRLRWRPRPGHLVQRVRGDRLDGHR